MGHEEVPCDPFTKNDAGGTPASKLLSEYCAGLRELSAYFRQSPDRLGPEHMRLFQSHLFRERKLNARTIVQYSAALRFFFVKTLRRHYMLENILLPKEPRKLPTVLSQ